MAFAQGSRSRLSLVVESSFGATPSSPSMLTLPFTSQTLDLTKQTLEGNDILPDRIPRILRHGNRNAVGDITVDLRANVYDELLESLFFSSLASGAGSMSIGTTPQFLTIEDAALDITQFRQFTGMAVSQARFAMSPNNMVETVFSMVGKDMEVASSTLGTPAAAEDEEPFDSYSGSIQEGGSPIATVTGFDFTIQNSLNPTFVIGADTTPQLEFGRAVVQGQITSYFENATLLNKFLNETESSLQLVMDDGVSGRTYTWDFPNIKYTGASVPVQNPQSRVITLPFTALYDANETTNLKLTKSG